MKTIFAAMMMLLSGPTNGAWAADAGYSSTAPIPDFDLEPYVQAISDLHNYYILSPQAGGTLAERTNERNRKIRALFARIEAERRPLFATHRLYKMAHIRCKKSGAGGTKRCPSQLDWGAGYEVIPASMGDTRRHFKDGPSISGSSIVAVLGRAGRGTNEGDFWGTARLADDEVTRRVEAEKQMLRARLTAKNLPTDKALDMEVR